MQPIVAARQLDDDEDAIRVLLDARALERLRGERGGGAIQDEREPRAHPKAVHPPHEEITPRARTSKVSIHRALSVNSQHPTPKATEITEARLNTEQQSNGGRNRAIWSLTSRARVGGPG